ncbi:4-hydroxy-tetrahydrodipicolinate reductase [Cesiribacter andamanensis]|uniref:4-hydroxy-tetrahydrodipicolinate reductase n=1 Tax=Cesiribacter andamanensis AMV16 TaxID=1279009 RepID=M7N3X2_9BACT|nr:4-hydroxy-tetrahydrodipicolinate reductase [Cesiribacter andamanensis]EMR01911.1 Dihydrodipicolinate reductase [Cesiribacter andamanensis AMV16]
MNIALIGYGKMGQAIEALALAAGHSISHRIGIHNTDELQQISSATTDVAIEFTHPEAAYANVMHCLQQGVPVVCGTTGWLEQKAEVEAWVQAHGGAFFWASNFSIGVNLFFQVNQYLARLMEKVPGYEVQIEEIHHIHKKDAPSGTAITLAEGILQELSRKKGWANELKEDPETLPIISIREAEVPGTHSIRWQSATDLLELKHEAFSRQGFASGALQVAQWLPGRTGVFGMDDFLSL